MYTCERSYNGGVLILKDIPDEATGSIDQMDKYIEILNQEKVSGRIMLTYEHFIEIIKGYP